MYLKNGKKNLRNKKPNYFGLSLLFAAAGNEGEEEEQIINSSSSPSLLFQAEVTRDALKILFFPRGMGASYSQRAVIRDRVTRFFQIQFSCSGKQCVQKKG